MSGAYLSIYLISQVVVHILLGNVSQVFFFSEHYITTTGSQTVLILHFMALFTPDITSLNLYQHFEPVLQLSKSWPRPILAKPVSRM